MYNGAGQFVVNSVGQPVATNTVISSTVFNALTADLGTGLSTAICKDGQTTITANLPMAGFKHTGAADAVNNGDYLTYGSGTHSSTLSVPTRQVLTSGSAATYTTPANCRQIRVRMVGGGSGGTGTNTTSGTGGLVVGSAGTKSIFKSYEAAPGSLGSGFNSGGYSTNGANGTGAYSVLRFVGSSGGPGTADSATNTNPGGYGGSSVFGGSGPGAQGASGGLGGSSAAPNSGSGGGGAYNSSVGKSAPGGGAAEYVELIFNTPAATYTYTVGAGGAGGSTTQAGGDGGSGIIIVDEFY